MIDHKSTRVLSRILVFLLLAFALPVTAHHSVGVFDTTIPIVLKGTIADVYFANPHSTIFIDITEADGSVVRWAVESSGTLNSTYIRGYDASTVKVGDPIEVCGYAPKHLVNATIPSVADAAGTPRPDFWQDADKAITGRLLLLKSGPGEHWSHYGPLDVCRQLLGLPAQE